MFYRLIVAVAVLCLSPLATAATPQLRLPEFAHLQDKATESVDVTLGALPITMARWFLSENDANSAMVKDMLKGVQSVKVRRLAFAEDFAYSKADLDEVRAQLTGHGWSSLAQVRDRKSQQDFDVFVAMDDEKITGFTVVQSQPREFTIVNVVGTLDKQQVEVLRDRLEKSGRLDAYLAGASL